jgi:hypothetical protein
MRQSLARFSGPVSLIHAPSLADSITTTPEFRFSVHTGPDADRRAKLLIHLAVEGALLGAYSHPAVPLRSSIRNLIISPKIVVARR